MSAKHKVQEESNEIAIFQKKIQSKDLTLWLSWDIELETRSDLDLRVILRFELMGRKIWQPTTGAFDQEPCHS